ncbi:MAG TPA: MFS transporter [Candidatus Methanoperedenaceae archaeon]|nr:MFS transporter [Candidatus Methanoperedenaceae archaeon]
MVYGDSMDANIDKKVVLLITTMSSFLAPFMGSSVFIGLPSIGKELSMDVVTLSWVSTAYLLAAAMFLVPFGKIADICGRKKIFEYGISIDIIASLLLVFAFSEMELIALRVMQGIGAAMIFGTGVAILTSVYPPGERGKALGINVAGVYAGLSLGPLIGGFLTHQFGWRSIFLSYVPLELLIIVLVPWKVKGEWADAKGEKLDSTGSVIYGFSLAAMMCGFSLLPGMQGAWLVLAGIISLAFFVIWETKVKAPVLDMNLFRKNPAFMFSILAALINYSATFAVGFFMSLYLQSIKGLDPQAAGALLVAQPVVMVVFSPLAGRLSDKIEPRIVASAGTAFTTAGLLLLSFLNASASIGYIVASLAVLGFGFALFSSPNTNAVMSAVEKRFYGVASATLGTMRLTGQMLSMGIATLIVAVYMGNVQITPENYPVFLRGVQAAFIVFAAFCFIGIFVSLARGKVHTPAG